MSITASRCEPIPTAHVTVRGTSRYVVFVIFALTLTTGLAQQPDDAQLGGASRPRPQMSLSARDRQYKRIHQFALRLVLLSRYQQAEQFLRGHLDDYPHDAESHYLLGLSRAQQGDAAQAVAHFRQAVSRGLPAGRIVAGPRELLRSISDHSYLRELVEAFRHRLVHGPLVGSVTDDGAAFWFRAAAPGSVQVVVSRRPDFSEAVHSAEVQVAADTDYTAVARVTGLAPGATYFYRVLVNGELDTTRGTNRFRTFPRAGAACTFRLAFGGGAGYVPQHERMWDTIGGFDPLALLLLGDNVYIDDPESLPMQQYTYHRRQSRPEFRRLTARTAVFSIWDDHDFGTNDCWGGPSIELPKWKRDFVFQTFRQNWANPGYAGGDAQPGCWYAYSVGDVDFVMLDCRFYRTNPRSPQPTMLGPVQLAWVKQQLLGLRGTFKVICSSVPWDYRTKGNSRDTWNGYQREREELFEFIEQNNIGGIVLMSADRHRSDAWRIDREKGYPFFEFNSSRLTNQHVHGRMEKAGAIFSYNAKQSFGLVDFDTTQDDPTVTYRVVSIDGEVPHRLTVKRSQLRKVR